MDRQQSIASGSPNAPKRLKLVAFGLILLLVYIFIMCGLIFHVLTKERNITSTTPETTTAQSILDLLNKLQLEELRAKIDKITKSMEDLENASESELQRIKMSVGNITDSFKDLVTNVQVLRNITSSISTQETTTAQ